MYRRKRSLLPRGARRRGQSMVELALILPLIALILVGTVDLGRVFFYYTRMTNSVKEGALYGANRPDDTATAITRAYAEADGRLGTTGAGNDFVVTASCYASITATTALSDCSGVTNGNAIQFTGTYRFRPITTFVIGILPSNYQIRKSVRSVI